MSTSAIKVTRYRILEGAPEADSASAQPDWEPRGLAYERDGVVLFWQPGWRSPLSLAASLETLEEHHLPAGIQAHRWRGVIEEHQGDDFHPQHVLAAALGITQRLFERPGPLSSSALSAKERSVARRSSVWKPSSSAWLGSESGSGKSLRFPFSFSTGVARRSFEVLEDRQNPGVVVTSDAGQLALPSFAPTSTSLAESTGHVRVLVVICAPVLGELGDDPPSHFHVDGLREWRRIREVADRFGELETGGLPLKIIRMRPPTLVQLRETLHSGRASDYAMVHLVGHAASGYLAMEHANGRENLIEPERLASVFRGAQVRLVVLNVCYGEPFAEALLDAGVQAVITTRDEISDPEATLLARELFLRLAFGDSFRDAHAWACKSIVEAYRRRDLPPLVEPTEGDLELYGEKRAENIILRGEGSARLPSPLPREGRPRLEIDANEPPNNLPIPDERFVGRGRELVRISDWMEERKHRVIAITGISGIGKSTLALRAAQRNRWRYHRIFHYTAQAVDGCRKPLTLDDVYFGIEAVLGLNGSISCRPTPIAKRQHAAQILNAHASLLVIESIDLLNSRERDDLAEFLQYLDPAVGTMAILTCCDEHLPPLLDRSRGDHYHLALDSFEPADSIAFLAEMLKPRNDRQPTREELENWDKIPNLSIPAGSRQRLSELATQVGVPDGKVLALEKLAAAAHHHPVLLDIAAAELKGVGNDWDSVLLGLKSLKHSGAHELVENKIGAMCQQLGQRSPAALELLQTLLVFSQGATRAALRYVWCGHAVDDDSSEAQNFDDARRTARRSTLLAFKADRYDLHGLVHKYLTLHLKPSREVQQRHAQAHAAFYLDLLRRSHKRYELLDPERRNLLRGMDWARETGDHRMVSEYARLLFDFLWVRGYWDEGRERMLLGAVSASLVGDLRSEAYLRFHAGQLHRYQGSYGEAQELFETCLKLESRIADIGLRGRLLTELGILCRYRCDYNQAMDYYRQCLELERQAPDLLLRATVLHEIGVLLSLQGRFAEAKQHSEQALALEQQINDRTMMASTLHQLSLQYWLRGDNQLAQEYCKRALDLAMELDNQILKARMFSEYGMLKCRQGDLPEAREFLTLGKELREQLGDRAGQAVTHYFLGELALVEGRCDAAEDLFRRGLEIADRLHNPYWRASNLYGLGLCGQMREYRDQARRHFDEALALAEQLHMPLADKIRRSLEELA